MHSTAANGERVWLEQADAVYCLAKVLQRRGVAFEKHPRQEQLDLANGLSLRTAVVNGGAGLEMALTAATVDQKALTESAIAIKSQMDLRDANIRSVSV